MSVFNLNLSSCGLDITDNNLKLVQVSVSHGGLPQLQAWSQASLPAGALVNGEIVQRKKIIAAAGKLRSSMNGHLSSELAVISLPEAKTFLKLFKLTKNAAESDEEGQPGNLLTRAIETELPRDIPLPITNIIYDYYVITEDANDWQVLIGAVPRDTVLEYTELVKAMGFKPLAFELEAQAIIRAVSGNRQTPEGPGRLGWRQSLARLARSFRLQLPMSKTAAQVLPASARRGARSSPSMIVDLGATRTGLLVYDEQAVIFTRTLEISGHQLTESIAARLKLSASQAEKAKIICGLDPKKCKGQVSPVMKKWVKDLSQELVDTLNYYKSVSGLNAPSLGRVMLVGGGAGISGLAEQLSRQLDLPVSLANPLAGLSQVSSGKVKAIPETVLSGFTTAIGLALR